MSLLPVEFKLAAYAVNIIKPYQFAHLIRRYRRFLADVRLANGDMLTVHCPNTGSMTGCSAPGSRVVISQSANPKRKYAWTLEMVRTNDTWVGVNTSVTNSLVQEAIENKIIADFGPVDSIHREVRVSAGSRLDFLLRTGSRHIYVEAKNCSLVVGKAALFPDAVTIRGTRHLHELAALITRGFGAGLIFCVQREDADFFMPAAAVDPVYTEVIGKVKKAGVHIAAYQAEVRPDFVKLVRKLPVVIPDSLNDYNLKLGG
ncbi:MAG: DNA/RNA nuclease SfsA [Desulfobulbaceae bacterium]|nr:DNA/RNA nuclease SfsA [Desulfobulbaceae bacterium]